MNMIRWSVLWVTLFLATGCGPLKQRSAVPTHKIDNMYFEGFGNIRYWGDEANGGLSNSILRSWEQERAHLGLKLQDALPPTSALVISGGGPDGAFAAGLLVGWSQSGKRPEFRTVTGVSTGALIAPFAFLGKEQDATLSFLYTQMNDDDIFKLRSIFTILRNDSVADTGPLQRLTERYLTTELLDRIAQEHAKGRRLFVATTHLDAQRPMIWDMGEIASSNSPRRLQLFRKVVLASASVPVAFPPQYFKVTDGTGTYDEMHVDGVATHNLFYIPLAVDFDPLREQGNAKRKTDLYVIVNGQIEPKYENIRPQLLSITPRAIFTLTKSQTQADLVALWAWANRYGIAFNLASVPIEVNVQSETAFDQKYMKTLFSLGYGMAVNGYSWSTNPLKK
jgi:predicted acylesterase/phospholipase RssA